MAGTKNGGLKAAKTNKERHGEDFYAKIGRLGGEKYHPDTRPFTVNRSLAIEAGRKGGQVSRRGKGREKVQPRRSIVSTILSKLGGKHEKD